MSMVFWTEEIQMRDSSMSQYIKNTCISTYVLVLCGSWLVNIVMHIVSGIQKHEAQSKEVSCFRMNWTVQSGGGMFLPQQTKSTTKCYRCSGIGLYHWQTSLTVMHHKLPSQPPNFETLLIQSLYLFRRQVKTNHTWDQGTGWFFSFCGINLRPFLHHANGHSLSWNSSKPIWETELKTIVWVIWELCLCIRRVHMPYTVTRL